jgi:predicted nucleic acid-binding protein
MAGYAYLDASAIVKLVVAEAHTADVERDAATRTALLSSRLSATEVMRAARRQPQRRVLQQVEDVLESFVLLDVTAAILKHAARLAPTELRTLDAIHLATALGLGLDNLDFLTYDTRLATAARTHGLSVIGPV